MFETSSTRTYRVPCVDAAFVRMLEEGQAFSFVQDPRLPFRGSITHGAQDDFGDLEARLAQATPVLAELPLVGQLKRT